MAQDVEAAFRRTLRDIVTEVLGNAGYDIDTMLGPPRHSDATSRSYCPRCHLEYVIERGTCGDCGGLTLRPLSPVVDDT